MISSTFFNTIHQNACVKCFEHSFVELLQSSYFDGDNSDVLYWVVCNVYSRNVEHR